VIVAERGEVTGGRVQILAFVRRWSMRPDASSGTPNFDRAAPRAERLFAMGLLSLPGEMVDDSLATRDIPEEGWKIPLSRSREKLASIGT